MKYDFEFLNMIDCLAWEAKQNIIRCWSNQSYPDRDKDHYLDLHNSQYVKHHLLDGFISGSLTRGWGGEIITASIERLAEVKADKKYIAESPIVCLLTILELIKINLNSGVI